MAYFLTFWSATLLLTMDEIRNSGAVIEHFGKWPSFHDAEIHMITLQRGSDPKEISSASLTMAIGWWAIMPNTGLGPATTVNQCIVTLRFLGLVLENLRHFGCQNVIFELRIVSIWDDPLDPNTATFYRGEDISNLRYKVRIDTSFGCASSFGCAAIEVVSIEPLS